MMKRIGLFSLLTLLTGLVVCWILGSLLIYPAKKTIGSLPNDLKGTIVSFPSSSGSLIKGWYLPSKESETTIILMHGVRSSRLDMLSRARFLSQAGYGVLLFDFQAHGESSGEHITFGYLESRDARAAVDFVRNNYHPKKIGLLGVSMGGAAALLADPVLDVDAIVLEMVYPTLEQAVINRITMRLGAWSSILAPLLTKQIKSRLGVDLKDMRPIDRMEEIKTPLFLISGSEDRHTTKDETIDLLEAAVASPSPQWWDIPGASHQDLHRFAGKIYEEKILRFFESRFAHDRNSSRCHELKSNLALPHQIESLEIQILRIGEKPGFLPHKRFSKLDKPLILIRLCKISYLSTVRTSRFF